MSQHSRFTTILEEGLDRTFAEHRHLDNAIEMWENMMFAAEYEYDDIIESYKFILSRTNEPWIQTALESAMLNMMFAAEYEYDDIIESYKFILSRTNEPWIQTALESAILKLSNS